MSWYENVVGITGPLWGKCSGNKWIPLTEGQHREGWYFIFYLTSCWTKQLRGIWDTMALTWRRCIKVDEDVHCACRLSMSEHLTALGHQQTERLRKIWAFLKKHVTFYHFEHGFPDSVALFKMDNASTWCIAIRVMLIFKGQWKPLWFIKYLDPTQIYMLPKIEICHIDWFTSGDSAAIPNVYFESLIT